MDEGILTPDQRIRVFVSSTLKELEEERQTVRKAIRDDLRLHPIMFEQGASPHPPREKYRAWLIQSNIYVGIFWESYGWIAPDMEISGIEDEYEIAKKHNFPRLVYVKNSKCQDPRLTALLKKIEKEQAICYKSFDTVEELVDLLKDDLALLLSERFEMAGTTQTSKSEINYLDQVADNLNEFSFVERHGMLSKIRNVLKAEKKVALIGEPGCGKTFLLGKIGLEENAIYISLREKTPLEVFTYLTNRLRIASDLMPVRIASKEEAKLDLEISLQNSEKQILLDDADQNAPLAKQLISLDYYGNELVIAARSESVIGDFPLQVLKVEPFTRPEIEEYLQKNGAQLGPGELMELLRVCHGNPLYLYYFVNYRIQPAPDGLIAYQDALWRQLNASQRELLGLIALSLFPLKLKFICTSMIKVSNKQYSEMEVASILSEMAPILRITDGYYTTFHPYFRELVTEKIETLGLADSYHNSLGEVNSDNNRVVEATYHFAKAGDKRANDHLLEAAHYAYLWGMFELSEDFLRRQVEVAVNSNDKHVEGYARYHLAFVLYEIGPIRESDDQIQKAIQAFEACDDQTWVRFAKIQQYLNNIWRGENAAEAIDFIREELRIYEGVDPIGEGMHLVNLSYAYIQLPDFEKGAETAKRAYEIFAGEHDYQGMTVSLLNLTACFAGLEVGQNGLLII